MPFTSTCQHCQSVYTAQRSTSKFCSPACRVSSHRQPTAKEQYDKLSQQLWDTIADMHALSDDNESVEYFTHVTLGAAASYLQRIYNRRRWWMCRTCHTKVHVDLPEDSHCSCGDGAFWVVLDTSS